jgi:hypothetical protein
VTGVTSNVGISLIYEYDTATQNRLFRVTKPDLTKITLTYFTSDPLSFIKDVLDSDLKVLESHTYDASGRGLTSSKAGGVEAITVTYPNP